jgi:hypothetical protein
MGNFSIKQESATEKEVRKPELNWEKECFEIGCAVSRQKYHERLRDLEDRLFVNHPPDLKVEGFRERTLVTKNFGEIRVRRRLYQAPDGSSHFLLDEYLEWPAYQLATPDLQEAVLEQSSQHPFRVAQKKIRNKAIGGISLASTHRLVQKTARRVIEKEAQDWQATFERGELLSGGERQVPILFCEGDGAWVHLQQEEQKWYEIKSGIAYEGWERLTGKAERYRLVHKRAYCHAHEKVPFWEGASIEWSRVWDLSVPREVVIGGDGATWIDQGVEEIPGAVRQLDGFHLARASGRGWKGGRAIYEAIRAGKRAEANQLIQQTAAKEGQGAAKARQYVENNLITGRDWRTQSETEGRGLGTMESNQDKLVCNRMKKRGLSWKINGALGMAKIIQLRANGEIQSWCRRSPYPVTRKPSEVTLNNLTRVSKVPVEQKWLQAGVPALAGPHASRPWAEKLRHMTNLSCRLN